MNEEDDDIIQHARKLSLLERIHRAVGPVAGGLILDSADLVTFGPMGFCLGPIIGALVGWWISSIYRFKHFSRIVWAVLAAIYCSLPATEFFPVATMIAVIARFGEKTETDDE